MGKRPRDFFFLVMSFILTFILVSGFGPTFFFRAWNNPNDGHGPEGLPWALIIHGLLMSVWLVLFLVQSALVQTNNFKVHKKLGWMGLVLVALIIPSGIQVMLGFGPRLLALGVPAPVLREGLSLMFWIDVFSLIIFPGLIGAAIYLRKKADWHKRLMLFAAISVIVPALARLTAQLVPTQSFGQINWPMNWVIFFVILCCVPLYDYLKTKKVHKATKIGFSAVFTGMFLSIIIAATEIGKDLAYWHMLD